MCTQMLHVHACTYARRSHVRTYTPARGMYALASFWPIYKLRHDSCVQFSSCSFISIGIQLFAVCGATESSEICLFSCTRLIS